MKKRLFFLVLAIVIFLTSCKSDNTGMNEDSAPPPEPLFFRNLTASEFVADIRVGWNLGNGFEEQDDPAVTKANIDVIRNAGFNAIRIPVSWYRAVDGDYNICEDWLAQITAVVNYAALNDMYIIINSHNDEHIFCLADKNMHRTERVFIKIWEQIAVHFKNYNEKLVFEAMNAPRAFVNSYDNTHGSPEGHRNLNTLNQIFVDTIRGSGGNNEIRLLIISPYDSSASETAKRALKIPSDSAENKIIVAFNGFLPLSFTLNPNGGWSPLWSKNFNDDIVEINNALDLTESLFIDNGIPVLIKNFGAINRRNTESRVEWAEYFVSQAAERGIPCFWWDNGNTSVSTVSKDGFGILDRGTNEIVHEEIVDALMRASG